MKKKILLLVSTVLLLCIIYIVYKTLQVPETPVHYHANFAVFINNTQVDFSNPSHMHLGPCIADPTKLSLNKLDNVHLHDRVGNVVHLHQKGIAWNDLFTSIKYDLPKALTQNEGNTTTYYLNGKKVDNSVLSTVIGKQDRLLITSDTQPAPDSVDESEYYKKQYEQTGSNANEYDDGTIGAEHCGAEGKRSFAIRLRIALQTLFSDTVI